MTYSEFVSQFQIYDNPPKKDGYDRHHIVPESEQVKMYGSVTDERQIYVSLSQHMYAHILYDREHDTNTAKMFLKLCGKSAEYFDCWEKCLAYSYTISKKREEGYKKSAEVLKTPEVRKKMSDSHKGEKNHNYGQHLPEETRQKMSDSLKGEKNPMHGQHHSEEAKRKMADAKKGKPNCNRGRKYFNNGIKNVMSFECPEGFVPGRLKMLQTQT